MKKTKVSQGVQMQERAEAMEKVGRRAVRSKKSPLLDEDELFERARRAWLRSCDIPVQPQNDRRISADGNTITLSNANGVLAVYQATKSGDRVMVARVGSSERSSPSPRGVVPPRESGTLVRLSGEQVRAFMTGQRPTHPLTKVRRELPFDERRLPIDPEILPLVRALNATGWIVTVSSCSGLHEGALNRGHAYIHVAVCNRDVPRLADLLNRLQLERGEDAAWVLECSLVFEESVVCSCNKDRHPDVAFFDISMELWGHTEAEGKRQLSSLAELISKVA